MSEKHMRSAEQFKAPATQTRGAILKLIGQRTHTQAELAQRLGLATPTLKRHIDSLLKAGLIAKKRTERTWNYRLMPLGHAILNPEEKTFLFLLITTCIAALGGLFGWLRLHLFPGAPEQQAFTARTAEIAASAGIPWGLLAFLLALGCLAGMTAYFGWRSKRNRDMITRLSR